MSIKLRGVAAASLFAVFAMLSGCAAGPTYRAMDPAVRTKIAANHVVVGVGQQEIIVDAPPPVYAGGGLIGALISSSIENSQAKSAETSVAPLRNAMLDFDFDNQLQTSVQASLAKVDWLHADKVEFTKTDTDANYDSLLINSPTPYVTLLSATYHISHDMKRLQVNARLSVFAKPAPPATPPQHGAKAADDLSNALYWVPLVAVTTAPDDEVDAIQDQSEKSGNKLSDTDAAVAWWSANNGARIKAALARSIDDINQMLLLALQSPYVPGSVPPQVKSGPLKGHVVTQEGADRAIVQFEDGSMQSLPSSGFQQISN